MDAAAPADGVQLVLCSCPDAATAEALAAALVEARLAACASVLPGLRSVYRWQGAVERADEALLLVKTTADRLPALQAAVLARHPYELPEILAVAVGSGLDRYLDWVRAETR
jgi:periplasmic divalent cation tolerance protein